jgi:glycosyltransferase involved in cell wall biosynthesis
MTPRLSILVTTFQRGNFLQECITSIQASSFRDFEILIVDDASTDNTWEIAERLASADSRIKLYRNASNLGQFRNRNRAAELATGEFLKYVDSDDIIYPHSIELMLNAVDRDSEIALALSHSESEAEAPYPIILDPEECFRRQFLGRGVLSCGPSSAIIRTRDFHAVGGFTGKYGVVLDIDLWLRLAARGKTALLPPGLVWWRRHSGQAFTGNKSKMEYLTLGYRMSTDALMDRHCPLGRRDTDAALRKVKQHHARRILALALKDRSFRECCDAWRLSDLTFSELLAGFMKYRS